MSALEAALSTAIGFAVSWSLCLAVLGYTPSQSLAVTLMFTGASFLRQWAVRSAFARWQRRV